ncbi:hypothetical protein D3C80_1704750 [compost metagenome]
MSHDPDALRSTLAFAFVPVRIEAADFLNVLLRVLVGEREEATQTAEKRSDPRLVLLIGGKLILVALVDEACIIDRRDTLSLSGDEIRI